MSVPSDSNLGPHHHSVVGVLERLPEPNYLENRQPIYDNAQALAEAVHALHETRPVTTPRQIDALQAKLTELATGKIEEPIIITGRCAEELQPSVPAETLAEQIVQAKSLAVSALGRAVTFVPRALGQKTKPRSAVSEKLADGRTVPPYMGDAVNAEHPDLRTPDPTRMVAAAEQASRTEAALTKLTGQHVPAAHEALLLPYEHSFVRVDPETGKKYLVSADLPWIGERTKQLNGEHVAMLAEVENPVGVKIGPSTTAEYIEGLQRTLNPKNIPGKLVLMMRVGPKHAEQLTTLMLAIKKHAPQSIIMYDIHGVTRTAPTGEKIRYTGDIIADIKATAAACKAVGLKLHGLHLETIQDNSRLECVDKPDQLPTHPGGVDPQLNPRQTKYVLEQVADDLL